MKKTPCSFIVILSGIILLAVVIHLCIWIFSPPAQKDPNGVTFAIFEGVPAIVKSLPKEVSGGIYSIEADIVLKKDRAPRTLLTGYPNLRIGQKVMMRNVIVRSSDNVQIVSLAMPEAIE